MVHVEVCVLIIVDLVVVLVFSVLQQTLVTVSVISCAWGRVHIIGISLCTCIPLLKLLLGVLVKTPEGQHNKFVVGQCSENKENEAEDSLPMELFKLEKTAHNPDDQSS